MGKKKMKMKKKASKAPKKKVAKKKSDPKKKKDKELIKTPKAAKKKTQKRIPVDQAMKMDVNPSGVPLTIPKNPGRSGIILERPEGAPDPMHCRAEGQTKKCFFFKIKREYRKLYKGRSKIIIDKRPTVIA